MITITNADAALKDYYLDAVNAQLNGEVSPFFNAIQKTSENVFGKDVKLAIAKGGMNGVVAGEENGDLPEPRANRYYSVSLPLKNMYGTIEITDKAIRASRDASGAFVNLLNAEMEGLIADAKANFARMLYGDGNGYVFTVTAKKSGKVLSVSQVKSYFVGYNVTFIMTDGSEYSAGIVSVDKDAKTVTIDTDFSSVTFDGTEKAYITGAYGNELSGLGAIFDGTTLYGYTKSSEPYFSPAVTHVTSTALSESDVVGMIDSLEEENGTKPDMILCSHAVRKQLAALMDSSRRIVNSTDIAAGYSSIVINDVPVYADKFCPNDRIYFVNTQDFILNQLCDWAWLEDEDGRILKQISGKAAYNATLVKYAELVCKRPCGQGLIVLDEEA